MISVTGMMFNRFLQTIKVDCKNNIFKNNKIKIKNTFTHHVAVRVLVEMMPN